MQGPRRADFPLLQDSQLPQRTPRNTEIKIRFVACHVPLSSSVFLLPSVVHTSPFFGPAGLFVAFCGLIWSIRSLGTDNRRDAVAPTSGVAGGLSCRACGGLGGVGMTGTRTLRGFGIRNALPGGHAGANAARAANSYVYLSRGLCLRQSVRS